jgi:hypothetical protein
MAAVPVLTGGLIALLVVVGLWEAIWKAIAMWKSARNNQLAWFVCILIFNTAGILPIIYILWFQKKRR